jgi:hypothetical protein
MVLFPARTTDGLCFVDEPFTDRFPPGVLGVEHNLVSREGKPERSRPWLSEPVIEGVSKYPGLRSRIMSW